MLLRRDELHRIGDPVWIYDARSGIILEVNQAALTFLELSEAEFLKQTHDALTSVVWKLEGSVLRSKSASPQTGKAVQIPLIELDLTIDDMPCRLVIAAHVSCDAARAMLSPAPRLDSSKRATQRPAVTHWPDDRHAPFSGAQQPSDPIPRHREPQEVELMLLEAEAYLENAQSLLDVANWRYHYNTGRIDWSSNTASVLRREGDALPRSLADYIDVIHPEDRDAVENEFRKFRENKASRLSFAYRLNNTGEAVVHIRGKGKLVETPEGMTLVGIVQNVTEETKAKANMQLLRHCLKQVNDIIIVTEAEPQDGPDGQRIVFANEAFERVTGFSVREALSATPRILQGPDTDRAELRRIREFLAQRRPVRSELLNYTKDGTPYWIELDIVPVEDDAGRCTHLIAIQRDITERRNVEERMRKSERLEALGRITGGIAHDFNNFLTVLLGNSETLASRLPEGQMQEIASLSVEASLNAADLVRSLLAFARRQRLEPVAIDVNKRISEFAKMLKRVLPENICVRLSLGPDIWSIEVDPGQLESCLLNLCMNSRDALPGGGDIIICTENFAVERDPDSGESTPDGGYVAISVIDTGSGMSEAQIRHAFEPFYTTKSVGSGTGLGLSSVHGFVSQSGGQVSIQSTPGSGTCIRLEFPKSAPPKAMPDPVGTSSTITLHGAKVLLVEDNMLVMQYTTRLLREFGMDVVTASTGAEAIERLRGHPDFQLVFTDIVLPGGMNGFQIGKEASKLYPDIKVIYTTGYSETTHAMEGALDPSMALIRKPYTELQLYEKFAEIFSGE